MRKNIKLVWFRFMGRTLNHTHRMKNYQAEKSLKDLEQARKKDKELFEEAIENARKLSEVKLETFKEEMINDMNEKLAEALKQLKEQPHTSHSA
ncbi:hypothetical protein CTI12_AA039340 [Artemisia annua]|uniref:Uncharacterized protein n=1 Tax=Artemisia annua TaxID=35608 RepID=A0A2U1QEL7_ARTAN|nr:hypothetical protein CTI12_AA039340 [Artemisia annua]